MPRPVCAAQTFTSPHTHSQRDHPAYRWLRYPLLPVLMSATAYRIKTLGKGSSSTTPTSVLDWLLQQLPSEGVTGAVVRVRRNICIIGCIEGVAVLHAYTPHTNSPDRMRWASLSSCSS